MRLLSLSLSLYTFTLFCLYEVLGTNLRCVPFSFPPPRFLLRVLFTCGFCGSPRNSLKWGFDLARKLCERTRVRGRRREEAYDLRFSSRVTFLATRSPGIDKLRGSKQRNSRGKIVISKMRTCITPRSDIRFGS